VHDDNPMYSRLFLHFLSLILVSNIQQTGKKDRILKNLSVSKMVVELESLVIDKFPWAIQKSLR